MSDTCPKCRAPKEKPRCKDDLAYMYEEVYECGYDGSRPDEPRTSDCMLRQIANLEERLKAWRMLLYGGYAIAVYTETGPERIEIIDLIPPDVKERLKEKGEWPE